MTNPSLRSFLLLAPVLLAPVSLAQQRESDSGLVALYQARLDASTSAVVLNVAAHPDDEASRTRLMLRRKHGARVVTAYATYGDGGQNAIGREIGPELAYLRVRETLAAAAMSDVEVSWLGMDDFGFSKTLEETLAHWGADRLRNAMRTIIDRVQPDFIVTNHHIERGHGHHRACAWAVLEVLKERAAAGARVPPMFGRCGPEDAWVTVDPGELDPARGETYARLAHEAWVQHVTQGPWGPHDPLRVSKEWWELVYPANTEKQQFVGWEPILQGAAGLLPAEAASMSIDEVRRHALDWWMARLATANATRDRSFSHAAMGLQRLALAAHEVRVETWLDDETVPLGGKGKAYVVVHGHERLSNLAVSCDGIAAEPVNAPVRTRVFELPTPPEEPEERAQPLAGRYSVEFAPHAGEDGMAPTGPEPSFVTVEIKFDIDGVPFALHPSMPYTTVNPIAVSLDRDVIMVPKGAAVERTFSANVRTYRDSEPEAAVRLSMGPGIQAASTPGRLHLTRDHSEARLLVRAAIDPAELTADPGIVVGYHGSSARIGILPVDVRVPDGLRVGIVRGPDDTTERALADLGVATTVLERDTLMTVPLETFSTLLLDIRANYHRPDLAEVRGRILEFCRAGGRVVVMYHKPGEWNARDASQSLAPFPLTVGNDRVTEEDAPVKLLSPEHRLWHHPNAITLADFDGWVQERGLNFPSRWDPAWTPLLEMKDSGDEDSHQGALLYTRYGKGDYVYCSLALYRQLRIGNAGAARLLVNLLAQ